MSDEKFDRMKKCAVEMLSVEADSVTMEASFIDDLGADSLDIVEFVQALEEEFDIEIDEEELEDISTVGQAYQLIAAKSQG